MKELFRGSKIVLTGAREGDAELVAAWHDNSDFLRHVDTDIAFPQTAEDVADLAKRSANAFPFYIRLIKGEALVGFISLHSIEWNNRAGILSLGIGEKQHRGKGYAAEAIHLALQYAFCELNLRRVGLDYIDGNEAAARLYRGMGFVEEGRARAYVERDGQFFDRVYMGLLREEWAATQVGG